MADARLHRGENRRLIAEPRTDDEGKSEARQVGRVELLKPRQLLRRELIQSRTRLLTRRLRRQFILLRQPPRQIRMRPDQRELPLPRRPAHRRAQRRVQLPDIAKWPLRPRLFRHPRRMLKQMPQRCGEGGAVEHIYFGEVVHR